MYRLLKELNLSPTANQPERLRLNRLRNDLKEAEVDLAAAERELEKQQAEIRLLEQRIRLRLGKFVDNLARLEEEIIDYRDEIARRLSPMDTDSGYLPVEEQYRRVWESAGDEVPVNDFPVQDVPENKATHFDLTDEKQVKRLYRQLARRYHPDLAEDSDDINYRTKKMAALNEAYAARRLDEMAALASETNLDFGGPEDTDQALGDMSSALEKKLTQIRERHYAVQVELQNLNINPVIQLSLESKLAQRSGRDLLGEMILDLRYNIRTREQERDRLRYRLNNIKS